MRFLVVLIALAGACDLQPAPKKAPPAATPPTEPPTTPPVDPGTPAAAPIDAGAPAPVAVADAPVIVRPPPIDVTEQCVTVGSHVAAVLIEDAQDPSKKSILIQERTKIVRRTAESCTRDAWNAELIACYLRARNQATLQACRKPDAPTGAPPVPSGAGPR